MPPMGGGGGGILLNVSAGVQLPHSVSVCSDFTAGSLLFMCTHKGPNPLVILPALV